MVVPVSFYWVRRNTEFQNKSSLGLCTKREMKQGLPALCRRIFTPGMPPVCQVTEAILSLWNIKKDFDSPKTWDDSCRRCWRLSVMEMPSRGRNGLEEPSPNGGQRNVSWRAVSPLHTSFLELRVPIQGSIVERDWPRHLSAASKVFPLWGFSSSHTPLYRAIPEKCKRSKYMKRNWTSQVIKEGQIKTINQYWPAKVLKMIMSGHSPMPLEEMLISITFLEGPLAIYIKSLKCSYLLT